MMYRGCVVAFGICSMAVAGGRDAKRVTKEVQPVIVEGIENLEPEVAEKLLRALQEYGPFLVRQDEAAQASRAVYLDGTDGLWLSDPALAQFLEDVAFDLVVNGTQYAPQGDGISIRDSGDRVTFRVNATDQIHVIEMIRRDNGTLETSFAASMPYPGDGEGMQLRVKVLNGKVNTKGAREHYQKQINQDVRTAAGSTADAHTGGCAATDNGVCCSFTNGDAVRIVCMCQNKHNTGFILCGDSRWLK